MGYNIYEILIRNYQKAHQPLRTKSNLAVEVDTTPTAADAPWRGMSTTLVADVDVLGDVEFVFTSDAWVIPDFKCGN